MTRPFWLVFHSLQCRHPQPIPQQHPAQGEPTGAGGFGRRRDQYKKEGQVTPVTGELVAPLAHPPDQTQ